MALSFSSLFATPEQSFWRWFETNEDRLFAFESDQRRVFADLASQMRRVHESLTFEFGPIHDGRREFVISANGDKKAFPSVESLHSSAPSLQRWIFIRFRPRREPLDLVYNGIKVRAVDIRVLIGRDPAPGKLAVKVSFPAYESSRERDFMFAAFLLMDGAVGEFDTEMKVGFIGVGSLDHPKIEHAYPLKDFPAAFDRHLREAEGANGRRSEPGGASWLQSWHPVRRVAELQSVR